MMLTLMSQFPRARNLAIWPILLALLLTACSRPVGIATDDLASSPSSADSKRPQSDSPLPFQDSQSLPAGTLLTVRLMHPIAAENPEVSQNFDAVVDESVLVEGNALLPRGASVAGRVESARASGLKPNRVYLRLTLDSINIGGRDLPVQTSSLFVRGKTDGPSPPDSGALPPVIRLDSGRRLTFRLIEPLPLTNPSGTSVH